MFSNESWRILFVGHPIQYIGASFVPVDQTLHRRARGCAHVAVLSGSMRRISKAFVALHKSMTLSSHFLLVMVLSR
jgi:hypothetical protein